MKRKMSFKVLSILLAAVLVGMLGGCGANEEVKTTGTEETTTETAEETTEPETTAEAENTEGEATEKLRVGLSFTSLSFPYYVRMYDQFMALADENGWEVTYVDGNMDAGTQVNGIQDLLNKGIDVLAISSWYLDAMEDVMTQCAEEGIPVFYMGKTKLPEGFDEWIGFTCGSENYDAGYLGGAYAAKYFAGEGKDSVNLILMFGATEQQQERRMGFVDGMKDGGIKVEVLNDYEVSSREKAMSSGEDALTAYSEVDAIFGTSAQAGLGAYDATVGSNRKEVCVFGYDGEDEEVELIDKGTNYVASVTLSPAEEASAAVDAILKHLNGESYDGLVVIDAGVYTKDGQLTSDQVLGD